MRDSPEMKRLSAYLPDPIYEELELWADEEKRSLSNLVGYLLEAAVREHRPKEQSNSKPKEK